MDLYLTAEAIGEENVGKHFDELLAQQRALISDYFKQSPAAGAKAKAETDPGPSGSAGSSGPPQTPQTPQTPQSPRSPQNPETAGSTGVAAERPGAR